ncbi:MAG: MoxR family ATPase [Deltaproteobacteria bacterium]|nr:MoxR family ATPase [Candidatus Anaeroferrophillacea bacterium]
MQTNPAPHITSIGDRRLSTVIAQINRIILGKNREVRLALTCLLAGGHLLIEDLPGVGKTTLVQALATVLGLDFSRIQFTSDLLPADIVGVSIYDRERQTFTFHPGPLFAQMVLADEINRATPRTQSALLEAMEEGQTTVDGVSHRLPEPFFVVATRNPLHQAGTWPLPESQLDRFLMRLSLGYPDAAAERELLAGDDRRTLLAAYRPELSPDDLRRLRRRVHEVHVGGPLLDYLQALIRRTRTAGIFVTGLSPRAGIALRRAAQAWALLAGRDFVAPDDLQTVFTAVAGHRLRPLDESRIPDAAVTEVLAAVPIP